MLEGHNATCYPTVESELQNAILTHEQVEVNRHIITSQALGSAIEFALVIVHRLLGKETADKIANDICFDRRNRIYCFDA